MNHRRRSPCFDIGDMARDLPSGLPVQMKEDWLRRDYAYRLTQTITVLLGDIFKDGIPKFPIVLTITKQEDNGTIWLDVESNVEMDKITP